MITIHCDKCDKPFEIEDDAAGEKVQCPYCGDINRVPMPGAAAAMGKPVTTRPAAAVQDEPERTLAVVRQAMFRAHPFWYSLMVIVFLGGIVLAVLAQSSQQFANARWLVWVGVGFAAAAVLWWLIWWAAPHRWVKLTITNKRTIRQEGIVVRRTSEVLHDHIQNLKIEQGFLDRLLGVGSISIDSAGASKDQSVEIEMRYVPRPYKIKSIIDQHRKM